MLKIQNLLHICSEHFEQKEGEGEKEKEKDKDKDKDKEKDKKNKEEKTEDGSHQGVAVLGIALIAMGEEIGSQMALRTFSHLVSGMTGAFSTTTTTSMFILIFDTYMVICRMKKGAGCLE